MALTEDEKATMRAATRTAAIALLDDVRFIGDTVSKRTPSQADVRLMSGVVRRLLLDNHLSIVAGPRVGRVRIPVYDSQAELAADTRDFVSCGLAPIYGWGQRLFTTFSAELHGEAFIAISEDQAPTRLVTGDGLLNDRVARLEGQWVNRKAVLEFICYHDYGVHYRGREEPQFAAVRRFRNALTFHAENDDSPMVMTRQDLETERPSAALMDLAQSHMFSTAFFLVSAPEIASLVANIEVEMRLR